MHTTFQASIAWGFPIPYDTVPIAEGSPVRTSGGAGIQPGTPDWYAESAVIPGFYHR